MQISKAKNNLKTPKTAAHPCLCSAVRIVKNVLCWGVLAALVCTVVLFLCARISGGMPTLFGYSVMRVSSGSMEPELEVGDVILGKTADDPTALCVGDVVTYEGSGSTEGLLVTHKIIKAPYLSQSGEYMLQTKGVANDTADDEISVSAVRCVMVCKLPVLSVLYNVFLSPWGFVIFLIALLFIFIDEVIVIVRILTGHYDDPDEKADINEIIDRISS